MIPHVPPELKKEAFNCPYCGAISHQYWGIVTMPKYRSTISDEIDLSQCEHCNKVAIWYDKNLVQPLKSSAPLAHELLPNYVKNHYEEASKVLSISPIASCALLRLTVEKIVDSLVPGSGNLNKKIGTLVKNGLSEDIQKALDSVRVIGSNALHPLQMDLQDDPKTAQVLFDLINIIVESTIAKKNKISDIFKRLPDSQKDAIKKRDNNS